LPDEVATALYYAAIAAALIRCEERITDLDDASLRHGFQWGVEQPWGDEAVKSVLREALASIPNGNS